MLINIIYLKYIIDITFYSKRSFWQKKQICHIDKAALLGRIQAWVRLERSRRQASLWPWTKACRHTRLGRSRRWVTSRRVFRSSSSSFLIRRSWRKRALEALSLKRFGNSQADRYPMSIERRLVGKIPLSQRQAFEIFIWERGLKRSKIPHSQRQAFEIPHRYSVAFTLLETFSFCKT